MSPASVPCRWWDGDHGEWCDRLDIPECLGIEVCEYYEVAPAPQADCEHVWGWCPGTSTVTCEECDKELDAEVLEARVLELEARLRSLGVEP
jgi:hypothetical protein